jgi:hypothetical protein
MAKADHAEDAAAIGVDDGYRLAGRIGHVDSSPRRVDLDVEGVSPHAQALQDAAAAEVNDREAAVAVSHEGARAVGGDGDGPWTWGRRDLGGYGVRAQVHHHEPAARPAGGDVGARVVGGEGDPARRVW